MKKYVTVILLILSLVSIQRLLAQQKNPSKKELDSIKSKLETLFMQDQLFRRLYPEAEQKFGENSTQMDYFWQVVEEQNKRIEAEFIKIIENYGWLGIQQVGRLANTAQFSIIQHSSVETKKRFAPLFKASVLKNQSQPIHYARMIDRMLVNEKKPQIYGTQITRDKDGNAMFFDIEQPESINDRRKAIGLGAIEDYAKSKGIQWNTM